MQGGGAQFSSKKTRIRVAMSDVLLDRASEPLTACAGADVAVARRVIHAEIAGLECLAAALDGAFSTALDLCAAVDGRVVVTGIGKSGHIARKLAATLASTGTPAFFVHAAEASHGDLGMITADDVIMALSWSGEQPEMKNLITYAKRFRIALITMTADGSSTLSEAADVSLVLPKAREACP